MQRAQGAAQFPASPAADSPATAAPRTEPVESSSARREVRLASGDLVEINVFGVPELKQETRINSVGTISLPLLGTVQVAGLTVTEAEEVIENQLVAGQFLNNPNVAILVKEYSTQGISVLGEVHKPGIYPLLGSRRLFDGISAAGGTTEKAGRLVTVMRREQSEESLTVQLSPDPLKNQQSNVEIFPGDTVYVSKARLVYVVGDVVRPGGFPMDNYEALSVLQALALAEGAKRTAKLDGAKLIRKSPDGRQEVPVPLKKILAGKSADVSLQADDILFVPASAGKNAALRTLDAIVQIATGVAVYSTIR